MKKIIVTPAGRQRYLEILLKNLIKNKKDFNEWHLWLNTDNISDINYCKELELSFPLIKTFPLTCPLDKNNSIYKFFVNCIDLDSVYVRLDDDIVYLEKDFCKKLFQFRKENSDPFLVYGNVINNSCISFLHQQKKLLNVPGLQIEYNCMGNMWKSSEAQYVEKMHNEFIKEVKLKKNAEFLHFEDPWIFKDYEHVSINCISWLGKTFASFDGNVGVDEERWLSCDKPKQLQTPNVVFGKAVCSHFSFYTQREHLDQTNLLEQYNSISHL